MQYYVVAYPHPSLIKREHIKLFRLDPRSDGNVLLESLKSAYSEDYHEDLSQHVTLYQPTGMSNKIAHPSKSLSQVVEMLDQDKVFHPFQSVGARFPNGPHRPQGELIDVLVITKEILEFRDHFDDGPLTLSPEAAGKSSGAPSQEAKHDVRLKKQRSDNPAAIYDDRPPELSPPPIQIYHQVFSKFLSLANSEWNGEEETLRQTSELIQTSRKFFGEEKERVEALRPFLRRLVHPSIATSLRLPVTQNSILPHGVVYVEPKLESDSQVAICALMELKNEVGTGGCDPALQCQSDFVKIYSSNQWKEYSQKSCCPVFMLAIAGPRFLVSGAVFADTFICQELTDYITLGSHPTHPDRGLRRVAQVLHALKECIQDLVVFYTNLADAPLPPRTPHRLVFPCYTKYTLNGHRVTFRYIRRLTPMKSARAVFLASITSPSTRKEKRVVIKFTRSYCPEAHRLLAELSLAPELLYHGEIEGAGVQLVVMEWLLNIRTNPAGRWTEQRIKLLRHALDALHSRGFVFGDLREPNIIITDVGPKLVDFDWCGKGGEVRYPVDLSKEIKWPDGVDGEEEIRADHDRAWFEIITGEEL